MKNRSFNWFAAVSILITSLFGTTAVRAYSDLNIVGDSLSDVGNLFIATGGTLPQDPPYFQGRFSDGESYSEHLYRSLGLPGDLMPSFAGGTNYAVGGARTRYHTFDNPASGFDPTVFDPLDPNQASSYPLFTLGGQVQTLLVDNSNSLDSQALFTVWIGSNDVADAFTAFAGGDPGYAQALIAQSASDVGLAINAMVGAGAKHLLVPTVPNLGLVPEVQALLGVFPQAEAVASALSQAFNSMVDAQLASITADITRLDTYKFLTDLVADPESFGLPASTNVTDPCFTGFVGVPSPDPVCPNPEAYVFFDKIHPSAATHEVLGRLASNAVPVPLTAALLGLGLGIFGYQRRRVSA